MLRPPNGQPRIPLRTLLLSSIIELSFTQSKFLAVLKVLCLNGIFHLLEIRSYRFLVLLVNTSWLC